jgi:hypothetical protein
MGRTLVADIARGWRADPPALLVGVFAALAVSGPTAIGLVLIGIAPGAATAAAAVLQLATTYWIAGRHARRAR